MVQPVKNTKFDEYLEYPCPFTFKIMGLANVNLTDQILAKLQPIAPGDYAPKVKPSSKAVSDQFKGKNIIVCLELHTYSSLDPEFIKHYAHSLESADEAIIFYDPEALKIKNRVPIPPEYIEQSFAHQNLRVVTDAIELKDMLLAKSYTEAVLVMMSSGNFGGMDWSALQQHFL